LQLDGTKNPELPISDYLSRQARVLSLFSELAKEYPISVIYPHTIGAKQFSNKLLSRQAGVARSAIMNFKKGRNTIKPRTLRKQTQAIYALQSRNGPRGKDYGT
jgi:hypothetical protein